MDIAQIRLNHGTKFPYDAPDAWWEGDGLTPPPAKDWGIIYLTAETRGETA